MLQLSLPMSSSSRECEILMTVEQKASMPMSHRRHGDWVNHQPLMDVNFGNHSSLQDNRASYVTCGCLSAPGNAQM